MHKQMPYTVIYYKDNSFMEKQKFDRALFGATTQPNLLQLSKTMLINITFIGSKVIQNTAKNHGKVLISKSIHL